MSPESIKAQLLNITDDQLKTLSDVYYIRCRNGWLTSNGRLNLVLGALTIWLGSAVFSNFTVVRSIQLVIGTIIFVQSMWVLFDQNTVGMLRFSIVFLISGVWNIILAIGNSFSGSTLFIGFFGVLQLWWSYQAFISYRYYQKMNLSEPPSEINTFYDDVWHYISSDRRKDDPDLIQMWINRSLWYVLLLDNIAAFAFKRGKFLIVQRKNDSKFITRNSDLKNRRVYGQVKLNDTMMYAFMNKKYFQQYANWVGFDGIIFQNSPSLWKRLPRVIRVIFLGIGILILLYIIVIVIGMIGLLIQYR